MITGHRNVSFDLIDQARTAPGRGALLLRGQEINYRQLDALAWGSARWLHAQGVRRGQIVALSFDDEVVMALAMLGLTRMGATLMAVPRSATSSQREEWTRAAGASVLLGDRPAKLTGDTALPTLHMDRASCRPGAVDAALIDEAPAAPIMIRVGSGSTGRPKLMPITHAQFAQRIVQLNAAYANTAEDAILCLPHLEYATPHQRLHGMLAIGGAFIVLDRALPHPLEALSPGSRARLSTVQATVIHVEQMLRAASTAEREMLHRLRVLTVGSSTVGPELRERIRAGLSPALHVNYGTNESGTIALLRPGADVGSPGSVGTPVEGVRVDVVDGAGQVLPRGCVGLVRIRSPGLIDGYLNDHEASATAFRDGAFLPGDRGAFTMEGSLVLHGRADAMMILNGVNIHPVEIEKCMLAHPQVRDAAAMPVPHPVHQDIPVCAVALHDGATVGADALLAHALERMGFRGPRRVLILDAIPRNEQGKLVRMELARRVVAALAEAQR
jgi:acyl-coenzyme A synthetase/AMP-(fatty) acid ligase